MVKILEIVIDKIILPTFPEIKEYEVYEKNKFYIFNKPEEKYNNYIVKYFLTTPISIKRELELKRETETIFKMLNPNETNQITPTIFYEFKI